MKLLKRIGFVCTILILIGSIIEVTQGNELNTYLYFGGWIIVLLYDIKELQGDANE